MSGSTTLTPALMFSRVVERISRLKRSSWPASSSRAITSSRCMPEPRSTLVRTRRADAAPMEAASRRSVNWIQARSAVAAGCSSRPRAMACSEKARRACRSPTMRTASACRSSTLTLPGQSPWARVWRSAYGSRNGAMRRRSSTPGRQRAEISIITAPLNSSDQNVPWVSGSQPLSPNNCCGRSHCRPNGPACTQVASRWPEAARVGSSRV